MLKTSLYCLVIAVAMRFAWSQTVEVNNSSPNTHALFAPNKIGLEWRLQDELRVWLSINSFYKSEWPKEGWHPGFTYIISHYKPMVKQLPNKQWQITFTSEIAENIP